MTADSPEAVITAWLATQQEAMLGVLEAMVNTDGGSYDKPGVDAVGASSSTSWRSRASRWRWCRARSMATA